MLYNGGEELDRIDEKWTNELKILKKLYIKYLGIVDKTVEGYCEEN